MNYVIMCHIIWIFSCVEFLDANIISRVHVTTEDKYNYLPLILLILVIIFCEGWSLMLFGSRRLQEVGRRPNGAVNRRN